MELLEEHIKTLRVSSSCYSLKCILKYLLYSIFKEKQLLPASVLQAMGNPLIRRVYEWLSSRDIGNHHSELRKISAFFLCELAYANSNAQLMLSNALEFLPLQGKVAINALPSRIELLLKEQPEVLMMLKKEDFSQLKYWTFPPLDPSTYKSSLDNLFFFPDPSEYLIGYYCVKLPEQMKGISTENLKEPINYPPTLYSSQNYEMQSAPVEVLSAKRNGNGNSLGMPISRIKVALKGMARPKTSRNTPSPARNYLSPTAASALKTREKSPVLRTRTPDLLSSKRKQLSYKIGLIIKSPRKL